MSEQRQTAGGWWARWREHRWSKGQQALERRYFERPDASACAAANDHLNAATKASAYGTVGVGFWSALGGGDGGGS